MTANHHIETGWAPDVADTIRAFCRNCETWFGAWCFESDYHSIRRAEEEAKKPFADFECFHARRAGDTTFYGLRDSDA